eukprot:1817016-Rhodomonas_salina.1
MQPMRGTRSRGFLPAAPRPRGLGGTEVAGAEEGAAVARTCALQGAAAVASAVEGAAAVAGLVEGAAAVASAVAGFSSAILTAVNGEGI